MSKMLIVDDEEKIRAVVREYAEFEVCSASSRTAPFPSS